MNFFNEFENQIQKGTERASGEQPPKKTMRQLVRRYIIGGITITALFLALFILLGFTSLLGGPYGFFIFMTIITLIGAGIWGSVILSFYRKIRKIRQQKSRSETDRVHVRAEVIEEEK